MTAQVRGLVRRLRRLRWALRGRFGASIGADLPPTLTVIVSYDHPARMVHLDAQVRQVLRCRFVGKLILLNDNPEVPLTPRVTVRDPRLVVIDQQVRRGCGHRWLIAPRFRPTHLIAFDDDLLLEAVQIARLFRELLRAPEVPHGFSGMREVGGRRLDVVTRMDTAVDYLVEAYAITAAHLERYGQLHAAAARHPGGEALMDRATDFLVVSRTGAGHARIHDAGRLLRCETFRAAGIAVHRAPDFEEAQHRFRQILDEILHQSGPPALLPTPAGGSTAARARGPMV